MIVSALRGSGFAPSIDMDRFSSRKAKGVLVVPAAFAGLSDHRSHFASARVFQNPTAANDAEVFRRERPASLPLEGGTPNLWSKTFPRPLAIRPIILYCYLRLEAAFTPAFACKSSALPALDCGPATGQYDGPPRIRGPWQPRSGHPSFSPASLPTHDSGLFQLIFQNPRRRGRMPDRSHRRSSPVAISPQGPTFLVISLEAPAVRR